MKPKGPGTYTIRKEPFDKQVRARRFNPALEIEHTTAEHTTVCTLKAGHGDELHVFQEKELIYVLSLNRGMPCIGLQEIDGDETIDEIFLQEHEAESIDLDRPPAQIAADLRDYMM